MSGTDKKIPQHDQGQSKEIGTDYSEHRVRIEKLERPEAWPPPPPPTEKSGKD